MKKITYLASVFIMLITASCKEEVKEEAAIIRPVRYEVVEDQSSTQTKTFSGVSKAATEIQLSFRVSGIVNKVSIEQGSQVLKGDVLATIDDSDAQIELQKSKANEENSRVALQTVEANLKRTRTLYEANNVSLAEYEKAKNDFSSAKTNYKTAKKSWALKLKELSYFKLKAPINGVIGTKKVNVNENVQAGTIIADLNSGSDLEVRVGVASNFISKVITGDQVKLVFPDIDGGIYDGTVTKIAYVAESGATYPVFIKINNVDEDLRPGMAAKVSFTPQAIANDGDVNLMVSLNAVEEDDKGNFVFIVEPSEEKGFGTIKRVNITIGGFNNKRFEVLAGLNGGEYVVNSGISKISEGLKVKFSPNN